MRALLTKIDRMFDTYKAGGTLLVFERLCSYGYIPGYIFYISSMDILKMGHINKKIIRSSSTYTFKQIFIEDIEKLVNIAKEELDESNIRGIFISYFHKKNQCFVAINSDNEVVGYIWVFSGKYVLTWDEYRSRNIEIKLQQHQKVLSDLYIRKADRMRGVYPLLLKFCINQHSQGTIFLTTILNTNQESLKSAMRLGFQSIGKVTNIGIFKRNYYKYKVPGLRCWKGKVNVDRVCRIEL